MTRNRLRAKLIGVVGAAGIATTASAQTFATYILTSSNSVIPSHPTTTISVWAMWTDPNAVFFFLGGNYDLTASDSTFLSGTNVLNGPGSSVGVISGNTITGASNGQLNIPRLAIPNNPILLAMYEWTTTDFSWRTVIFETSNTDNFIVADRITGATTQLYPNSFFPGIGQLSIGIPPSPSTVSALALGGLLAARRKRRS